MRKMIRSVATRLFRRNQQLRKSTAPSNSYGVRTALEMLGREIESFDYILTCGEVEALADLLRSYGLSDEAERVIHGHAEYDECGDSHHDCGPDCDEAGFDLAA
ncbi:hypothetical protein ACIRVF_11435 [Kitasatospora sp. NPDC101157]|uniref:hypothetical protein n=1 Tax=Kitasatospora sp. NPDC101157 TaxID=3364098 RepID=UPI00380C2EE1